MATATTPYHIRKLLRNFHLDSTQTGTTPDWYEKTADHWLTVCRGCALTGSVKLAELGGAADTPFEQAFSNLAHAYVKDKAPKLLEYEVGFQLIEKNQENTKAVGVFGFKVGDQWLYAPVFFLNGDLKGHELLYLKHQDIFVPLKDNWLNYLLGRKPSILGKTVPRNLGQLGVLPPNLYQLSRTPYKYAAAGATLPPLTRWFKDFLPTLGYLATSNTAGLEKYAGLPSLPDTIRALGRPAVAFMMQVGETYPTVLQAFNQFHGADTLSKIAREIGVEAQQAASTSLFKQATVWAAGDNPPHKFQPATRANGGVGSFGKDAWDSLEPYTHKLRQGADRATDMHQYVHHGSERTTFKSGSLLANLAKLAAPKQPEGHVDVILRHDYWLGNAPPLTEDEKKTVMEEGRLVRDKRPASAVSKAYTASTSLQLSNPDETNIFEVLVKPFQFERCLVILGPHGEEGRNTFCTVISLEQDNRWMNTHPSRVWVRSRHTNQAWHAWFDKLPDADSLPLAKNRYGAGEHVVLLGRNGQATTPLKAYEEYDSGGENRGTVYRVRFDDCCEWRNAKAPYAVADRRWSPDHEPHPPAVESVRLTGRAGTKLRVTPTELYVPAGFKKLTVAKPKEPADGDGPCCDNSSERQPLQLGDLADVQFALNSGTVPLQVLTDDLEVHVNDHKMNKESAFKHLVVDWGFNAETADSLLKLAEMTPRQWYRARVKLAGPHLTEGQRGGPAIPEGEIGSDPLMGSPVPTRVTDEKEIKVRDMAADPSDALKYKPQGPDAGTMQVAQQAAQTGQREVFDTAMLGSLLKAVRQDNMVDKYQGDLMKGMDRLGRIYFQFLWHGEEFETRYGKQDLPELEDGLRNAFEAVGDIILVLKRKSVEPFAQEGMDVDLSAIANQ
jgi:hypothetical protein